MIIIAMTEGNSAKLNDSGHVMTFKESLNSKFPKWKEAIFLTSVGGMSFLFGFGSALSSAKKKDADAFDKGVVPSLKSESGVALASRALRWGTFYAVTGCGLLFFCMWKMMGVKNLQEFRQKSGEMLPRIPRNDPPQSRTEFENLTDLLQYIIDEDNKVKAAAASSSSSASALVNANENVSNRNSSSEQLRNGNLDNVSSDTT